MDVLKRVWEVIKQWVDPFLLGAIVYLFGYYNGKSDGLQISADAINALAEQVRIQNDLKRVDLIK